jgi:hypothetical protein
MTIRAWGYLFILRRHSPTYNSITKRQWLVPTHASRTVSPSSSEISPLRQRRPSSRHSTHDSLSLIRVPPMTFGFVTYGRFLFFCHSQFLSFLRMQESSVSFSRTFVTKSTKSSSLVCSFCILFPICFLKFQTKEHSGFLRKLHRQNIKTHKKKKQMIPWNAYGRENSMWRICESDCFSHLFDYYMGVL